MFSRSVRVIAQIALFFFIIGSTLYAGSFGQSIVQFAVTISPVTIADPERYALAGTIAGALAGFLLSSVLAAGLIALFEIAENTAEMLRHLRYLSRMAYRNASSAPHAAIVGPSVARQGMSA